MPCGEAEAAQTQDTHYHTIATTHHKEHYKLLHIVLAISFLSILCITICIAYSKRCNSLTYLRVSRAGVPYYLPSRFGISGFGFHTKVSTHLHTNTKRNRGKHRREDTRVLAQDLTQKSFNTTFQAKPRPTAEATSSTEERQDNLELEHRYGAQPRFLLPQVQQQPRICRSNKTTPS
ncbi:hypothetical protein KC19_VG027800 [Ceratodon purpureus]|uniref:Uncharacterized protein n=1 Tax=Ceratodon purpureus TaxID=3225 RepID=A0A8T0HLB4_CERPU|nr:hypothetical protein KC19_VG027800 [Ceratodon purpureus]